jgi:transcriptional regulator with XRE-family HTH domain
MSKKDMTPQGIKRFREYQGYDIDGLAQVLGVSTETVQRWEKGKSKPNDKAKVLMQIMGDPELRIKVESLLGVGETVKAEFVGYVPVNSGQIIMADPCYLDDWNGGDYELCKKRQTNDYGRVADITLENRYGEYRLMKRSKDRINHIVASTAPGGDGMYPVFAIYKNGEFVRLEVRFEEY